MAGVVDQLDCQWGQLDLLGQGPNAPPFCILTTVMANKNNRILSKDQILVSCSHMTCYLQKLHYVSTTYFIDDFIQGVIKNPKIKEIH